MSATTRTPAQMETSFRYYVFQDERFVDLNLYQYGWERCKPLHQFGPAIRNHFLFHYIIAGRGKLEAAGKTFDLSAGQGFLLCPEQVSTYYADAMDPWTYAWVEFDGMRARECMTLAGLKETQPVYTPAGPDNQMQELIMNLVDHSDKGPMWLVGSCMLLLDEMIQTSKTRAQDRNKRVRDFYIKEAIDFIDLNYHRDISVDEIATACGLNRSYFGRLFKETMGQTPQQFLIQYRMIKAEFLLKSSRISIGEVSKSVGYENPLHFSRAFKNVFGVSPRKYRSSH